MADWDPRTNGTLRGFLIVVAAAAALTAAGTAGDLTVAVVFLVLRVAFIVVIGIVLFGLWRRNREDIASWPLRVRIVFYGGAALALVNLAAAQAIVIGQVAVGLLLLSDGRRTTDELHYAYGTFALLAVLSPWLYAPPVPARRLLWFVGASLFAAALSVRAYTTSS